MVIACALWLRAGSGFYLAKMFERRLALEYGISLP